MIFVTTRNPGKLREIRDALGELPVPVAGLEDFPTLPEPAETGATFAENARLKAHYYAQATGQWCLADDSGLAVDALGGRPGVHSARFAAERIPPGANRHAVDHANNQRLLEELAGLAPDQLTARFLCHLALSDGRRVLLEAQGALEGLIVRQGQGHNGFGYDPHFYVPSEGLTLAQMPAARKNAISHRGQAVRRLGELLRALLARP
ncbi:MAG: RdgB/HAM1 family non-canonical purine NTP pyrophosphatase [Planctomycetota bacterium]|nr:RdgB/HAM1 family non-canonical purine NTP pyrophosphatase [Planctomycetota bacterium]